MSKSTKPEQEIDIDSEVDINSVMVDVPDDGNDEVDVKVGSASAEAPEGQSETLAAPTNENDTATAAAAAAAAAAVDATAESTAGAESASADDSKVSYADQAIQKRKMKQYQIQKWTKDEDALIIFYKEEKKYSWKTIANLIGNKHSWQAVQMRYLRSHKQRNEQWTKLEEVRLINAIKRDWEKRWTRISNELGSSFNVSRCLEKIADLSKNIEEPRVAKLFESREINYRTKKPVTAENGTDTTKLEDGAKEALTTSQTEASGDEKVSDIKDAESHKKLMLVYMGLDSISYDSDEEE